MCRSNFQLWYLNSKGYTVFSFETEETKSRDIMFDDKSCFWCDQYFSGIDFVSKDIDNLRMSFTQLHG